MTSVAYTRDLFGPGQTSAIKDLLQSLFVAELLQPSSRLWLAFGWISDIEILDNRTRQFAPIQPDWPASHIRLSQVLRALIERGGHVAVILRDVEHNRSFINRIEQIRQRHSARLLYAVGEDVHKKGIVGDDFLLSGSMNLTYNGITVNDEHLTLRTDPASVQEWRVVMQNNWGGALK